MSSSAPSAFVTRDGVLTGWSDIPQQKLCPLTGDERHEVRMEFPLAKWQRKIFEKAEAEGRLVNTVRFRIRSGPAQLGVDGLYTPDAHEDIGLNVCVLPSGVMEATGLLSIRVTDNRDKIRKAFLGMARYRTAAVANAMHMPSDSHLGVREVPVEPVHYAFSPLSGKAAVEMVRLGNSAREVLEPYTKRKEEPLLLVSKGFGVGEIHVPATEHHLLIDPSVYNADGTVIPDVRHGNSCHFFAGRGERGDKRQLELWNTNGCDASMEGALIRLHVYRACTRKENE